MRKEIFAWRPVAGKLEDRDIFFAVCKRKKDLPIEMVMDEYARAKFLNMKIEAKFRKEREAELAKLMELAKKQPQVLPKRNRLPVAVSRKALWKSRQNRNVN